MSDGTGLTQFEKEFPDRFFDVGIAEQHAATMAGGLAIRGMKPFVAIYSTFMQRGIDQIIHDIALQKLPVVFCLDRAGLVGEDGATHHGAFDLSFLNFIPNLVVLAPTSLEGLEAMMDFAAEYKDGPVVIRYPRGAADKHNRPLVPLELGKFEVVKEGGRIALLGIGSGFKIVNSISEVLKERGIEVTLVNPRFLKPLDTNYLESLKGKVEAVVTIEENALIGGFGSRVAQYYAADKLPVYSYGLPDEFIPHGATDKLKEIISFTPEKILEDLEKKLPFLTENKKD
jgi:1-deoxy-D-xylulose-5-phosphate synthase